MSEDEKRARRAQRHFEAIYEGAPPWETGRPQSELVALQESGAFSGSVLDIGCGTGENAILLAARGHEVFGVDVAENAIARAQAKAAARGSSARFAALDARDLATLGRQFDTTLDSGLFHIFADHDRPRFVAAVAGVLRPGGLHFMLCFSEKEPGDWGPRRVRQAEIRAAFSEGWHVREIRAARYDIVGREPGVQAWLAVMEKAGGGRGA